VNKPFKSVIPGDIRPMVTFLATVHFCPMAGKKNYAAWRQKHNLPNFDLICSWLWYSQELNSQPLESQANTFTITSPGHRYTTTKLCRCRGTARRSTSTKYRTWKGVQ